MSVDGTSDHILPHDDTPGDVALGDFASESDVGDALGTQGWTVAEVTARQTWSGPWGWCRGFDVRVAERPAGAPGDGANNRPSTGVTRVWAARLGDDAPESTMRVEGRAGVYGLWVHPNDPALPGLAAASTVGALSDLLGRGVGPAGHRADEPLDQRVVEIIALEPLQRAVVRIGAPGRCVYVKVLPPATVSGAVDALVDAHRRVGEAGVPTADVVAVDPGRGLVVLSEVPGTSLAEHLEQGRAVPSPGAVAELVTRIAGIDIDRPSPTTALAISTPPALTRIGREVPTLAARCVELAEFLDGAAPPAEVMCTIHGDLHDRQLLVNDGLGLGVVDLDDLGRGDLLDDLGRLIAHVAVRALTHPRQSDPIQRYVRRLIDAVAERADETALRQRAAMAMVGLAAASLRLEPDARPLSPTTFLDAAHSLIDGRPLPD